MGLEQYHEKRSFERTPEPEGVVEPGSGRGLYVIQKHAASRLHYDLRLEMDGVLKSWAVPKGPSLDPSKKRLAAEVEDHPIEYGSFEGIIPKGEYGGGTVMLWDRGVWEPLGDPHEGYAKGDLKFRLHGERLKGSWVLARMKGKPEDKGTNWLLIKKRDEAAISESGTEPVESMNQSVASGRTMDEIAAGDKEIDPSKLPGARPARQPEFIEPELATLADAPPSGEDWIHEIKYDGYRIQCVLSAGRARLVSRNGKEWTDRFSEIARAASQIPVETAILDGEVAVVDQEGRTDFQALQNILQGRRKGILSYLVFDILFCGGYDLTQTPLLERKELLRRILLASPDGTQIRYSDHIRGRGETVFSNACGLALEGIISKEAHSPYEQKRSRRWLKVKCAKRQEFVIAGFTDPGGSRPGFGALLAGYHDSKGDLVYCGRVGTGFDEETLESLAKRFAAMEIDEPEFTNPPTGSEAKGVHWTRPELVAEVEFGSWTEEGILRHASFKGLREDKDPREIVLESRQPMESPDDATVEKNPVLTEIPPSPMLREIAPSREGENGRPSLAISNPDRVYYPDIGVTKRALAEYYADIAQWVLPHLVRRPLSLLRCPEGREKECFFQKHLGDAAPQVLRSVEIVEKHGREVYSVVDNIEGVIALVQIGVLEIHVWGSRDDKLEQPDMLIFDLDPAPEVVWKRMIGAAHLVRDMLSDLGLRSFVKTTGGKGLHIVVPLTPKADWGGVKEFAHAFADGIVRNSPREYIATMSKEKRRDKIFVDYLRNGRGSTSIAAYSTRARPGAPIATPISWEELTEDLKPDSFHIGNIRRRLSQLKEDPWKGYFEVRQSITEAIRENVERAEGPT